jgi:hypothetical protein
MWFLPHGFSVGAETAQDWHQRNTGPDRKERRRNSCGKGVSITLPGGAPVAYIAVSVEEEILLVSSAPVSSIHRFFRCRMV